ncbi:MAG: undecaprenyl-diphosphate phosphatase [Pusillimonas sp.]|nr:undecaprenyl-diphosphate phosphatase [Pusillimonas sp.]MAY65518.1 undecaprenyl-diphosphate phosphatase [Rhodospirillaceae bacterium]|tara:strand:- start:8171 stop:9040 length:870 start_codon:yes stop_codon:yes gene_type:complete
MTESTWFLLKALILGLVEGFTEFIPVSSTAHLLLIGQWIGFDSGDAKVFEVVIQFGSILAVVWIFRHRLWQLIWGTYRRERTEVAFTRNLIIAFLPAAVIGSLAIQYIKMLFHHPAIFVVTLILGGLIMLWVERKPQFSKFPDSASSPEQPKGSAGPPTQALEDISWKQALAVGCAQCIAMIPGTSRSGATIIGGMMAGIERKTATEFSFFLAIPTMLAATVYDLYRHGSALSGEQTSAIVVGFVAAFFSALVLVKALLRFIARHTYRPFAWYRIALGIVVLIWLSLGS